MTPLVIQYPEDPTGVSPNNAVQNEPHTLSNRQVRVFATDYGAFYTESLKIRDAANNQLLTADQYYAAELYEVPSARYGKEICAIVVITDPTVSSNILVDYQALGGPFSTSATAIINQIENLNLDDRPVSWGNIIGKPSEFPPSHHLHDAGDVYGFEYLVHALDRIRAAIEMGDAISHDQIYLYIDRVKAELLDLINANQGNLQAHLADTSNPHGTTAAQVGAYTKGEVDSIVNPIDSALTAHLANTSNPHGTTAAQVGAYTKAETDAKITPLQTQVTNHINNTSNPHGVNKNQVGLSNVVNYPLATDTEAFYGSGRTSYVLPEHLSIFRNGFQTFSFGDPGDPSGYREGHIWWRLG